MNKTKFARFSVLNDRRGLILGKQFGDIFEKGIVYQITEIMGEYIIKPIGPYALPEKGAYPSEQSSASDIIESGSHLYTKDEYQILVDRANLKNKQDYSD